jgi:radical SAM superfamily enzyme YgiQ (UPF0313 family)
LSVTPKVVVAAVPFVDTVRPMAAPAVLKASLNANNIECVAIDFNVEVFNKIKHHPFKDKFLDFFYRQIIHSEVADELAQMINYCADEILLHKPDIVGVSLFCLDCQIFASWLCAAVKQRDTNIKIVIGGPGLMASDNTLGFTYPDHLKRRGLIDDYINGDGEESLVEYVKGNTVFPGINSTAWKPVDDLNLLPIPDYSDYKFFRYEHACIPVIDSRGCVQSCEFCDVITLWKKFQFLTAERIFEQMLFQMHKHKVAKFDFRSSITNGNLKEFKKLIKMIADHNQDQKLFPSERITWDGSFIIRRSNFYNEEFWTILKQSNPDRLFVGVESVIERVRVDLGKNFTNQDLDDFLIMAQKHQVPLNLMFIGAYPGETVEDFEFAKQWFRDHKHYANNTVFAVQITKPQVLPGTELEKKINIDQHNREEDLRLSHIDELALTIRDCGFELFLV